MRIALVVPGGVDRSGEYQVIPAVLGLIERLARRHDVHVVTLYQDPEPGTWDLLGARVYSVGSARRGIGALRTLLSLHRKHDFDVFHAIWAGRPGELALAAARICGRPVIVHVAGGELIWLPEVVFGTRAPWNRLASRLVLRYADGVTAASGPMLRLVQSAGAAPIRVTLGVDPRKWPPVSPRSRDPHRPARLVHVGNLTPVKDQATLLRAAATLARQGVSFQLDVVGYDALDGAIQRLAHQLDLADRVRFHGFLPQRHLLPVVRQGDLMIVSSRHEAGPVVVLEAAAVGVPTVGTAVGHVQDLAPDAACAVPVGSSEALALAVRQLLEDDARRIAIAARAQEFALRENADWTCAMFEGLYTEVQRRRARPNGVRA